MTFVRAKTCVYRETQFRSTLEARWAKTLDRWGVPWVYEPGLLCLSTGDRWLPDFLLPREDVLLEVKGDHNERLDKVVGACADYPDKSIAVGRGPRDGGLVFEHLSGRLESWALVYEVESERGRLVDLNRWVVPVETAWRIATRLEEEPWKKTG